jgi:hypothetical protein
MSSLSAPATGPWRIHVRTWLVLGRVSNLPTVWSNCLAAWLLGGGGTGVRLMVLLAGASLMYVGGMFLNDFCDAEFDRRHRSERPIPAGRVAAGSVGWAGVGALLAGWLLFAGLGSTTGAMGLLLVAAIGVYDTTHKRVSFAPAVMALCRYLLFVGAGSASAGGIHGTIVWSGLVLGGYVLGLSTVAQRESTGGPIRWWAVVGLAAPLVLSWFVNPGSWVMSSRYIPGWLLAGWVAWSLTHLVRGGAGGVGRTVSALLAGIVLVDLLAVLPRPWPWGMVFLALFAAARGLQRVVPAT